MSFRLTSFFLFLVAGDLYSWKGILSIYITMRYKIDASGMGRKDGRLDGWIDKLSSCFSSLFYLKNSSGLLPLGDRSVKFDGRLIVLQSLP